MLDSPKLVRWFTTNPSTVHPKLEPIPVGIKGVAKNTDYIHRFEEALRCDVLILILGRGASQLIRT